MLRAHQCSRFVDHRGHLFDYFHQFAYPIDPLEVGMLDYDSQRV